MRYGIYRSIRLSQVEIIPCDKSGKDFTENDDVFVEQPMDLVGKEINFKVKVTSARGLPKKFTVCIIYNMV